MVILISSCKMYLPNNIKYKCNKCEKEKSPELFCKGSTTKCKECHASYQRRWYFAKKTKKKIADVSLDDVDSKRLGREIAKTSREGPIKVNQEIDELTRKRREQLAKGLKKTIAKTFNEDSTDEENSTDEEDSTDEEKDQKIVKLEKTVREYEEQLDNLEETFTTVSEIFAELRLNREKK